MGLAVSAVASDTNGLFSAKELSVSLGTGYTLGNIPSLNTPYAFNLNAGAQYFVTKNIGLEVDVPFYATKGVSVNEVQGGLLFRVPLAETKSFWKHWAPYVGVGTVYNWTVSDKWAYNVKVGTEWRWNPKWGLFAEGAYRNINFDMNNGLFSLNGGVRLAF